MTNILFPKGKAGTPPATSLRIQSALAGLPRPLVWGQTRVAGNIICVSPLYAIQQKSGGGKGGGSAGKGNQGTGSYIYYVSVRIGICEGPISGIASMWVNKTPQGPTDYLSGYELGGYSQVGQTLAGDVNPPPIAEQYVVPSVATPQITVQFHGSGFVDLGVVNASGVALVAVGSSPALGQYSVNGTGTYTFNSGQAEQTVVISYNSTSQQPLTISAINYRGLAYGIGNNISLGDSPELPNLNYEVSTNFNSAIPGLPDALPGAVIDDFLTNQYYGVPSWPSARLGSLTLFNDYCGASGLVVSPALTAQTPANSFLSDLCAACNSEAVWSGGLLTIVPRGDVSITANGYTYTAPSAPLYSIGDDEWQKVNQATSSQSTASNNSADPMTITRLAPRLQLNDVTVEFLDRTNNYNPTIAEAKDDAAIQQFGLKPSGNKSYHFFCAATAAQVSAQLLLQRNYIRRQFAFTLPANYILLDPMDIVEITDSGAGLTNQWVRILEITENQDRTLSIVAEEVLGSTGAPALYTKQVGTGYQPNYNAPPGDPVDVAIFDIPVPISNGSGMETAIAACGGPLWGGAYIWIATASGGPYVDSGQEILGPSRMGKLTAIFASGSDPDTVNTCSVDLTESLGALISGTDANADNGDTLCWVDGELISYSTATLTSAYNYNLTTYIRRGQYETPISSHASGSEFVRMNGGVPTVPFTQQQLGQTVYIKLLSFNLWGGAVQSLADVSPITHVLTGPPVPPDVAGFEVSQLDGVAVFTWDPITTYPYVYDIGYAPVGTTSWGSFTILSTAGAGTEMSNANVPSGPWVFGIKARDPVSGFVSADIATATATLGLPTPSKSLVVGGDMGTNPWTITTTAHCVGQGFVGPDTFYGVYPGSTAFYIAQSTDAPAGFSGSAKIYRGVSVAGTDDIGIGTIIETIKSVAAQGQPLTFSFYAKAGSAFSASGSKLHVKIFTGTGTDEGLTLLLSGWTGAATPVAVDQVITTSWVRYQFTIAAVGSTVSEIAFQVSCTPSGTGAANDYFELAGWDAELANQASSFPFLPIGQIVADCHRFVETSYEPGVAVGTVTSTGAVSFILPASVANHANAYISANFTTPKRVSPSVSPGSITPLSPSNGAPDYVDIAGTPNAASVTASTTRVISVFNNSGGAWAPGALLQFHYWADCDLV